MTSTQAILSIDATCEPALAQVIEFANGKPQVLESHVVPLAKCFQSIFKRLVKESCPTSDDSPQSSEEPATENLTSESSLDDSTEASGLIKKLLSDIKTPWTASIFLVPTFEYIGLNLDLPFGDAKNVNKVLALEVQDHVPFDLSEFLISHRSLGLHPSAASRNHQSKYDVHVSLVPKEYINQVLQLCRSGGFEPQIVSTATSALAAVYHLAPQDFVDNSAIFFARDPYYYLTVRIDGEIRHDRVIDRRSFFYANSEQSAIDAVARSQILAEMRMTILSLEQRYQKKLEQIYVIGDEFEIEDLRQGFDCSIKKWTFSELVESSSNSDLASISSIYARELNPPVALTNFRVREFSFRPQMKELIHGLKILSPFFFTFLLIGFLTLWGTFFLRERFIDQLQASIRGHVHAILPQTDLQPGREMDALQNEMESLQKQLDSIGSQSEISPLDALAELSRDITASDINIRKISIRGTKIEIKGTAPGYASIAALEKIFKSQRKTYNRSKVESSNSVTGGKNAKDFNFEIWLSE